MNATRRRGIRKAVSTLGTLKEDLEEMLEDEDYARDNTPEALQGLDRFRESEEASDFLSDAISSISDAIATLEEVV